MREISIYKGRTLLSIIGIIIGTASLGAVLSAYAILNREMNKNFMNTNPASIILKVNNLDRSALTLVNNNYSNLETEMNKTIQARISYKDGTFGTIYLRVIDDFNNQKIDKFTLEKGEYPKGSNQIVLERDCLNILSSIKGNQGEKVNILIPGYQEKSLELSGLVHAPGLAPASMEKYSYGFMSMDGLKQLGYTGAYDELRIVSLNNRMDKASMVKLSQSIRKFLENSGYKVESVNVLNPGKHPHANQLSSLLFLLQAFSVISLIAASMIVVNLVTFIMAKQKKQISVIKTLGAGTFNVAVPYVLYILIISICAAAFSIPLGILFGNSYSQIAANILNFKILSKEIPLWVFLIQVSLGIIIPVLSAIVPIFISSRKSIKDGLNDSAPESSKKAKSKTNVIYFNSKLLIPLKNLFRKKSGLYLHC